MRGRYLGALAFAFALGACDDPVAPCSREGPAPGVPYFDVVGALGLAGADVEDLGERLETTLMGTPARELRVNGTEVLWHEYCSGGMAADDVRRFSADASTFDGIPLNWAEVAHLYVQAQVILVYDGNDAELVTLLESVMGPPFAEGPPAT